MQPHTPGNQDPRRNPALDHGRLLGVRNLVSLTARAALTIPAADLERYLQAGGLGPTASAGDLELAEAVANLRRVAAELEAAR